MRRAFLLLVRHPCKVWHLGLPVEPYSRGVPQVLWWFQGGGGVACEQGTCTPGFMVSGFRFRVLDFESTPRNERGLWVCGSRFTAWDPRGIIRTCLICLVQRHLTNKKTPNPPVGPPKEQRHRPLVGSYLGGEDFFS